MKQFRAVTTREAVVENIYFVEANTEAEVINLIRTGKAKPDTTKVETNPYGEEEFNYLSEIK